MITSNYIRIFESQLCLNAKCYECRYASVEREGDFTVGDFWGIEISHPEFEDREGVSLLMCNTDKARDAFKSIKRNLIFLESTIEECLQPNLQRPTPKPEKYEEFQECMRKEGFEKAVRTYCGYNPDEDWEKLESYQLVRRLLRKTQ